MKDYFDRISLEKFRNDLIEDAKKAQEDAKAAKARAKEADARLAEAEARLADSNLSNVKNLIESLNKPADEVMNLLKLDETTKAEIMKLL